VDDVLHAPPPTFEIVMYDPVILRFEIKSWMMPCAAHKSTWQKFPRLFCSFQLTVFVIPKIDQCLCISYWVLSFIAVELSIAVMGVPLQQHMKTSSGLSSQKAFFSLSHVFRKWALWQTLKRRRCPKLPVPPLPPAIRLCFTSITQTRQAQCCMLYNHVSAEILKYWIDCTLSLSLSLSLSL